MRDVLDEEKAEKKRKRKGTDGKKTKGKKSKGKNKTKGKQSKGKNKAKSQKSAKGQAKRKESDKACTSKGLTLSPSSKKLDLLRKAKKAKQGKGSCPDPVAATNDNVDDSQVQDPAVVPEATPSAEPTKVELPSASTGPIKLKDAKATKAKTKKEKASSTKADKKASKTPGAKKSKTTKAKKDQPAEETTENHDEPAEETAENDDSVDDETVELVNKVLQECHDTDCAHGEFDMAVPAPDFQLTSYWTRDAVGVKCCREKLAEKKKEKASDQKPDKKKWKCQNVSQIAYFSAGGCFYVNYALAQAFAI